MSDASPSESSRSDSISSIHPGNKNIASILRACVSPFSSYCSASGMQPTDAYITAPMLGTGTTEIDCSHSGSQMLDNIVAFDRAESSFANVTQTNMVAVSSFNGLQGAVLGYDLLPQPLRRHPLVDAEEYPHVYDAEPLFRATQALFGTVQEKHFPIAPGQHLLCAYKTLTKNGPCILYGALAVAIAKDRSRNADLYMEDHGTFVGTHNKAANLEQQTTVTENLIRSIGHIGRNIGVEYEKIFIGLRVKSVGAGEIGCVITAAPYIHLAKSAIVENDPALLQHLPIDEWKQRVAQGFQSSADVNDNYRGHFEYSNRDLATVSSSHETQAAFLSSEQ